MNLTQQIAKHFREVHFGGNWTSVNLRDSLEDLNWEQATKKIESFNTIAALVFHMNYYVSVVLPVFRGEPLNASDKFSFDLPPIRSQEDWNKLLEKTWSEAEEFARYVESMPDQKLWENMADPKYGNWLRNLLGVIEHCHYHLGQVVILKKLLH